MSDTARNGGRRTRSTLLLVATKSSYDVRPSSACDAVVGNEGGDGVRTAAGGGVGGER